MPQSYCFDYKRSKSAIHSDDARNLRVRSPFQASLRHSSIASHLEGFATSLGINRIRSRQWLRAPAHNLIGFAGSRADRQSVAGNESRRRWDTGGYIGLRHIQ